MLQRTIPSTGELLPAIGLGTWSTFDAGRSSAERAPLEEVLTAFVRLGGKVVDSSPMYGRAEEVVGDLAAKLGIADRLFLATKVWTSGRDAGVTQMENSMRLLRAPRIDLMQVHNVVDVDTHLATLKEWKRAGRVRYIGITHYHSSAYPQVERLLRRELLDFLQINYSLRERDAEKVILPLAAERGVAGLVNRPFGGGDLFQRVHGTQLPPWAAEIDCGSWAQLFLKWVVSHNSVTCAIPATANAGHLEDNMQAGLEPLPNERMRRRILELVS